MRPNVTPLALGALLAVAAGSAAAAPKYTAYVGNDQCPTNDSVSTMTGAPWTLGAAVGVGSCPAGIAFAPDGAKAWVLNAGDNTITPIDATTFAAGTPFPSQVVAPVFVKVTPNGKSLVLPGTGSAQLAIISTANTASVKLVPVGATPIGVAVLPDSSAAYVGNNADGTVSVVALGANPHVVKTIAFPAPGCAPYDMAVVPDGSAVLAACTNGQLWPIDTAKNKATPAPIAIPETSGGLDVVVTPNGRTAYMSNSNGFVYPVKLSRMGSVVGTPIPVVGAFGLAMSPDGKELMVGNGICCFVDTPVSIVSTATNAVTSTIETPGLYAHRWLAFRP